MFSKINYNDDIFLNYLEKFFPNKNDTYTFIELIDYDYISISGSSILQIIQNEFYCDGDLDIYIEINNINIDITIIEKLIKFLYKFVDNTSCPFSKMISDLTKIKVNSETIFENSAYENQNMKLYQLYENKETKFKIELIYIGCDIKETILTHYDFDIVKNYWKQFNIYSLNPFAILNKVATISLNKFVLTLIDLPRNFTKFIDRYNKYYNRGFKIFIHKTYISKYMLNYITSIYFTSVFPQQIYFNKKIHIYNHHHNKYQIQLYIDNKYISKEVKCRQLLYQHNGDFKFLTMFIPTYIIKYILISGVVQKRYIYNQLNLYSQYLLEDYLHPDSPYITYKFNHIPNCNKMCYINEEDKIVCYTFK